MVWWCLWFGGHPGDPEYLLIFFFQDFSGNQDNLENCHEELRDRSPEFLDPTLRKSDVKK